MSDAIRQYCSRMDEASTKVIDFIQSLRDHGYRITGEVVTAKQFMYAALGNEGDERFVFDYIFDNMASRPIKMPWGVDVYPIPTHKHNG